MTNPQNGQPTDQNPGPTSPAGAYLDGVKQRAQTKTWLTWWGFLGALACIVIWPMLPHNWAQISHPGPNGLPIGLWTGGGVFALVLGGIGACVGIVLRRKVEGFNAGMLVAAMLMGALFGFSQSGMALHANQQNQAAITSAKQTLTAAINEETSRAKSEGRAVDENVIQAKAESALQAAIAQSSGKQRQALQVMADLRKEMTEHLTRFQTVGAATDSNGAWDFALSKSREELKRHAKSLAELAQANSNLKWFFESLTDNLAGKLRKLNFSGDDIREAQVALLADGSVGLVIRQRRLDAQCLTQTFALIEIMDANFGNWNVDPDKGLVFKDAAAQAKVDAITKRLDELALESQRLSASVGEPAKN